jgi:uncharacterized protein (TIRG00374 family)
MELVARFRRWVLAGIALGALLYLVLSLVAGLPAVAGELSAFRWELAVPILGLSLVNYALRFAKWHYLLRRLAVRIDVRASAEIFASGLAMTITPGKAGELLKPYLVRAECGAPVARTLPALVTERATDAMALLLLAGLGVTTHFAQGVVPLIVLGAGVAAGLAVVASERISLALLRLLGKVPGIQRFEPRLEEAYRALRTCLSPLPLLITLALSAGAWGAECVGYFLTLQGLHVEGGLSVATFLYAFSTIVGAPSPGGLGMADTALGEGAVRLVAGITRPQAVASALLCRVATLWFGVAIGALALLRRSAALRTEVPAQDARPAA